MNINLKRVFQVAAGLTLGLMMAAMNAAGAQAAPVPSNVDPMGHIFDCFGAMLHNSAEHQQYCEPGQPGSNNSLVAPVPGGNPAPSSCLPFPTRYLVQPKVDSYRMASLDDAISAGVAERYPDHTQIAISFCGGCAGSISAPVHSSYDLASLDQSIAPAAGNRVGSLDRPAFLTFDVASLESVDIPSTGMPHPAGTLMAQPVPCGPL